VTNKSCSPSPVAVVAVVIAIAAAIAGLFDAETSY
jgi:hypothetical protein